MKNKKKSLTEKLENRTDHANAHRNLQSSNQGHNHVGNKDNSMAVGDHSGNYGVGPVIDITDFQRKPKLN